MPIEVIKGLDALNIRKANPASGWPSRFGDNNRVEPIAKPTFEAPFRIEPGDKVFTIGSCFARNIEFHLQEQGYIVPFRALLDLPEFSGLSEGVLNNYGAPSIRQEMEWAFAPDKSFDPSNSFVESAPGKFVDLNLPAAVRPAPLEQVTARRNSIVRATRLLSDCRLAIITLGLTEVWFDTQSGMYINETPRPSIVRLQPDRFELHVLDFAETYSQLQRALDLIGENAATGVQVLLTVSPVPLTATHRQADVMVANCYSKSVLRTAAEEAVMKNSFVHYYPSYESVTLSNRDRSWKHDLIHVTEEVVLTNVQRMLRAFGPPPEKLDTNGLLEKLADLRPKGARVLWTFLQPLRDEIIGHHQLSMQYARLAINRSAFEDADIVIASMTKDVLPFDREFLEVELAVARKNFDAAITALDSIDLDAGDDERQKYFMAQSHGRLKTTAFLGMRNLAAATESALVWSRLGRNANFTATPLLTLARGLLQQGEATIAVKYFEQVVGVFSDINPIMLDYAEALVRAGHLPRAREVLDGIKPENESQKKLIEKYSVFIEMGNANLSHAAERVPLASGAVD